MKFKQYVTEHWSEVPKYLWSEDFNRDRIFIYKYYGEKGKSPIYKLHKLKMDGEWKEFSAADPLFGIYTKQDVYDICKDSNMEVIELMDDSDFQQHMTLDEI